MFLGFGSKETLSISEALNYFTHGLYEEDAYDGK